ncbi:MAG: TetR family transcriptional regulator [Jatrophihabitans sp.]|nr:MAG: TetR family transcriptional regulator [Jatrophihabitans sp.]
MRLRSQRGDIRALVLDAAYREFVEHGVAGTTLAAIAARAGVRTGAARAEFATTDEIVLTLMREQVVGYVDAALVAFGDGTETEGLARMAEALTARVRSSAGWHQILTEYYALAHRDEQRAAALRRERAALREVVGRALAVFVDGGRVGALLTADDMAVVLLALTNGLSFEAGIDPDAVPADLLSRVLMLGADGVASPAVTGATVPAVTAVAAAAEARPA